MRFQPLNAIAAATVLLLAAGRFAAASETGPVIVVPGRAGVPVMMNGYDVSGAVIEGDWGLARPQDINPVVIYRPEPSVLIGPPESGYFPRTGRPPRYGRKEVEPPPNRLLPPPAENFHRSWTSQSDPTQAVTLPPPPYNPPPVIMAPPEARQHRPSRPPAHP